MCRKKKTNINFTAKPGTDTPAKRRVKDFNLPHSIMLQIFTEDSVIL